MILAPLQLFIGDLHGLNTLKHQPEKIAAIEGHWDGSKPGALVLFAWLNEKEERNDFEVSLPGMDSPILTHDLEGKFKGLKDFLREERPPVVPVFFAFRIMVGLGILMISIGVIGGLLWWRKQLFDSKWFQLPVQHVWPIGFIAILAGWQVTEAGRQPWIARGILKTADAASPSRGR